MNRGSALEATPLARESKENLLPFKRRPSLAATTSMASKLGWSWRGLDPISEALSR